MESRAPEYLRDLVRELRALPVETAWVEFKHNNANPAMIGKNISALSNGAALNDRPIGYLVWGVDDTTHEIIGTNFAPELKGTGPQEPRIRSSISENCDFRFHEVSIDGLRVVVLEINPAIQYPVRYKGESFIRVGSATKPLKDVPQVEARTLQQHDFENGIAAANLTLDEVLLRLDYPTYFDLLNQPLPDGNTNILDAARDRLITLRCV